MLRALLLLLACGCARQATHAVQKPDDPIIALSGVTLTAPVDAAWALVAADESEAILEKRRDHASLIVRVISSDSFPDELSFLRSAEARLEAAVSALEMVSVHYNRTGLGDATCLQYDGIFRDPAAAGSESEFLNLRGYLCSHPTMAAREVQMEFAQRSASRSPPDFEGTLISIDAFFRSAVFTNAAPE